MPIHFYEPRNGHGLPHDPFNAIVGPRPIGWISSLSAAGIPNLAPYSFFNAFNYVPPIVGFASIGAKDTLRNVQETGEFVWNLATRELADAMNASCAAVAPEVDEFALAGLTAVPSRLVGAPRVAESPVSFECKVTQVVQLQGANGDKVATWLVLGEVVGGAYCERAAQGRRLRHRRCRPHPARRWSGGLFYGGAGAAVSDASAALMWLVGATAAGYLPAASG